MSNKPRIVIIGAGMAGLTAANKLYTVSKEMFEICVVEGGSRIGGRINTSEFSGEKIEMGATWIHGIEGSPIYKIARETDSLVSDQPWECMDSIAADEPRVFAEGGFELKPSILEPISNLFANLMSFARGEISDKITDVEVACFHDFASRVSLSDGLSERSIGAFLKLGFDAYWESVKDGEIKEYGNWNRKSLEKAIFTMYSNNQRTYTAADDLFSLDFAAESEYQMCPGEEITIAKGYTSVINYLSSVLPPGLVQLNRKVTKIEWRNPEEIDEETRGFENGHCDSRPVKLHFVDGSVVYADHVVVTVSLGVLKSGIEEEANMFCPPLPEFKIEAIRRLGYGVVNKLFVETTPKNFPFLQMAFHGEESDYKNTRLPRWIRKTASLSPIHSNSRVLLSWFAGKEALELESLADEEILNGVSTTVASLTRKEATTNSVNGCLGDEPAGSEVKFTRVLKSKWGSDPLFLGSYSYVAVGSSGDDLDAVAEPLPKIKKQDSGKTRVYAPLQILFAGEATHRTHYSTTHGAYFSGLREAMRLLEYYHRVGC